MIGGFVQGYRIVKVLGSGAMGIVYLGEHKHIGRKVAVKVLRPELSSRPELVNRFFDEARAAGLVDHPGVVQVFDCDVQGETGHAFIIMELLEGLSLRDRLIDAGSVSAPEASRLIRDAADILRAVHQVGIVHRDLKPDNVFLLSRRQPGAPSLKILDFGIAKLSAELQARHAGTLEGSLLGTPTYMSPEQCRGALDIDARTDVYALGCMLFELLVGRPPFLGDGLGTLISSHLTVPPPLLAELGCQAPLAIQELVARMLAKQASERPTIAEIIEVLDAHAAPATAPTRLLSSEPVPVDGASRAVSIPSVSTSVVSTSFVSMPSGGLTASATDASARVDATRLRPAIPTTTTTLSSAASVVEYPSNARGRARGSITSLPRAIGIAAGLVAIAALIVVVTRTRAPRAGDHETANHETATSDPSTRPAPEPAVERIVVPNEIAASVPQPQAREDPPAAAVARDAGAALGSVGGRGTRGPVGTSRRTEPAIRRRSVLPSVKDHLPIE